MAGIRVGTLTLSWGEVDRSPTLTIGQYLELCHLFASELSEAKYDRVNFDRDKATGQVSVTVMPRLQDGYKDLDEVVRVIIDDYLRDLSAK